MFMDNQEREAVGSGSTQRLDGGAPFALFDRWCFARLEKLLGRIERGRLLLTLPNGETRGYGDHLARRAAQVAVHEGRLFRRLALGGDIALGEAYVDGLWDSDEPAEAIGLFHRNLDLLDAPEANPTLPRRFAGRLWAFVRRNTRRRSRGNIAAHYDLGNGLYELFLDPTMSYSAAIFERDDETLEAAQRRKMLRMIELADVRRGDHVLEIGCGWGSLAIEAARSTGCRVTGITLSENQLALARQRAEAGGVADRVRFELCDYRDLSGRFDRIIAVEMLEAVGHEYLGTFFSSCDRLLAPGGRVALQVITVPDQRYDAYRRSLDWLRKHIFPGGLAPSLTALCEAITLNSSLVVERVENIGRHYVRPLRLWRERFESQAEELDRRGYDARFRRMWRYYLAYCEAGFAAGTFGDLQIVLIRPSDRAVRARLEA